MISGSQLHGCGVGGKFVCLPHGRSHQHPSAVQSLLHGRLHVRFCLKSSPCLLFLIKKMGAQSFGKETHKKHEAIHDCCFFLHGCIFSCHSGEFSRHRFIMLVSLTSGWLTSSTAWHQCSPTSSISSAFTLRISTGRRGSLNNQQVAPYKSRLTFTLTPSVILT